MIKLEKAVGKIETELRKYLGDKKAIVGISGGVDSAVVADLCTRAIGRGNTHGILMPYGNQNTDDARTLVDFLGIKSKEVNIKKIVDQFKFLELNKTNRGNVMARTRMAVLYAFANQLDGLVIGTSNKSEIELGYFTKYGDGGVDIEPIGDLYKTEIFDVARILGIPQKIIDKKPSAELWQGQTDEAEIGATYEEIDAVLKGETSQGEVYEKIQAIRKNTEHKRKMPPIFGVR